MDIPALSISISQANVSTQANISVLKMANEAMIEKGEIISEMISESAIDFKI